MNQFLKTTKLIGLISIFIASSPFWFANNAHAQSANTSANIDQQYATCIATQLSAAAAKTALMTSAEAEISTAAAGTASAAETTQAVASVPVSDVVSAGTEGGSLGSTLAMDPIKSFFNSAAYILAQCTLTKLTDSTISWIKGGFHGSPSYAISPKKVFSDIAQTAADQLARQVRSIGVCDFTPNFAVTLSNTVEQTPRQNKNFAPSIKCPLQGDPGAFYNDFTNGGWNQFAGALNDAGNPFGVAILTGNELEQRQQQKQAIQTQQLAWSKGFFDVVNTDPEYCGYVDEKDHPDDPDAIALDSSGRPDPAQYDPAEISAIEKDYCTTSTPGNIISDKLSKTLGTDTDRLGLADNMDKLISALMTQLVQESVKGLFK